MATAVSSGVILTSSDIDDVAVRIGEMFDTFNEDRLQALTLGQEARNYVFATDIDGTSANILPHKNRTHQPKLTQISDTLQSQYFEASLSMPEFFQYGGDTPQDEGKANKVRAWVKTKLEQKKFRETVGRQLIADYVVYGNCFAGTDFILEKDNAGAVVYKGPIIRRISPLDITFNPRAESFAKSPKIERKLIHIAELASWPTVYPSANFKKEIIDKVLACRSPEYVNDWVDMLKEKGLNIDGFSGWDAYFKQGLVELLIYRGDIFDPEAKQNARNRIVYVVDRVHIFRNEPNPSPANFDGLHHAGWRIRPDNLWAQGPLDNLVGMQYRIDHLENLKADVFDRIANPVVVITGEDVSEPTEGNVPGSVYYAGAECKVEYLKPEAQALNADTQIAIYHRLMDEFAGAPPDSRGIRTPGEKTAFEVSKLDQNATMMFVDKARNFERMLELILREIFDLMLIHYDGSDYVKVFDDVTGAEDLKMLSREDVVSRGNFTAVGARFWTKRNRETMEMNAFMAGPLKDSKIRAHVSGEKLADFWKTKLGLQDSDIFQAFAGVKEDVAIQAISQAEAARFQDAAGPIGQGNNEVGNPQPVFPGQEAPAGDLVPSAGGQGPSGISA